MNRFAKVPEEIFLDDQLDVYSKMVMSTLYLHADGSGRAFPSINTITRLSGMAKGTVVKRLSRLEKLGYLTRQKRKEEAGDYDRTIYILRGLSTRETTLSTKETTLSPENTGVVSLVDRGCLPGGQGVVSRVVTNIPIEQIIQHTKEREDPSPQGKVLEPQPKKSSHMEMIKTAFSEFWKLYPKKQGKMAALEVFSGLFPAALGADRLNQRFQNVCGQATLYAESVRDTEPKYIKNPVNWLRECDPDERAVIEREVWVREGDE